MLRLKLTSLLFSPMALWEKFGSLGLNGLTVAEEHGGLGRGYLDHVIVMEEVSQMHEICDFGYGFDVISP